MRKIASENNYRLVKSAGDCIPIEEVNAMLEEKDSIISILRQGYVYAGANVRSLFLNAGTAAQMQALLKAIIDNHCSIPK
tara:strand:- start:750 stop:989 length:240 start_codon:yes stop_codon:yes gene_type:complete